MIAYYRNINISNIGLMALLAFVIAILAYQFGANLDNAFIYFLGHTLMTGAFTMTIFWTATARATGWLDTCLRSSVTVYIGKISYGVYIWHSFAPGVGRFIIDSLDLAYLKFGLPSMFLNLLITLMLASATFFLFERPINSLKRFFYPDR